MPRAEDDRSTLLFALESLGPVQDAVLADPTHTLRQVPTTTDEAGRIALESLLHAHERERTVTLGDTLGQGGMGVVYLAEQVALGRMVAVKRLREDKRSDRHALALMREAWVTGGLEHPNIVPVHDVGLDADGRPFLVMKRIEGEHWGRLIDDPAEVEQRYGVSDIAGWHLGVLLQVCHAVAFAHSRQVIHRDLKPENVMVGAFGEVYLLDWGIAISLVPDPSGRLPTARPGAPITGTPAYMAPEMLGGEVGTHTDVFLLGGLLYQVLTGRPPHRGEDLESLLEAIRVSRPMPPDGPDELVALCMEALSADPSARPPSAEAFRQRLARHLEHRQVLLVAEGAQEGVDRLVAQLAEPNPDPEALWNLYGEARFGFRQALKVWLEHDPSQRGLARAVQAMVRWRLDRGDAAGAARLLAEDPIDAPELEAEVRRAERRAALRERDRDSQVGQRTRWVVTLVLASTWFILPLVLWWKGVAIGHQEILNADVAFVLLVLGLGFWARESLSKTALNRRTWGTLLFLPLAQIGFSVGAIQRGLSPEDSLPLHLFLCAVVSWMVVITLERGFLPTAIAYAVGWLVAASRPVDTLLLAAGGNLVFALNITAIWWPPRAPSPQPPQD